MRNKSFDSIFVFNKMTDRVYGSIPSFVFFSKIRRTIQRFVFNGNLQYAIHVLNEATIADIFLQSSTVSNYVHTNDLDEMDDDHYR